MTERCRVRAWAHSMESKMKLTIAAVVSLILCGGSLVARASIVHRRAAEIRMEQEAIARANTPAKSSERLAMNGLETRLGSRLHRLAERHAATR